MLKISSGIIILNDYNELLLGHSTGNKHYDIPKGLIDDTETPIDCALRECMEEFSLSIDKNKLIDLGEHKYIKGKNLYLFLFNCIKKDIDINSLSCKSFFTHPISKKLLPEIDSFKWCPISDIPLFLTKNMSYLISTTLKNSISNKQNSNIANIQKNHNI